MPRTWSAPTPGFARFLAEGGTAIGSCGGAYYLSAGRPGWTGTAQAKPLYTHEYLQSGVGVTALEMRDGPLALGCPPTMEVPYYHGPDLRLCSDRASRSRPRSAN